MDKSGHMISTDVKLCFSNIMNHLIKRRLQVTKNRQSSFSTEMEQMFQRIEERLREKYPDAFLD